MKLRRALVSALATAAVILAVIGPAQPAGAQDAPEDAAVVAILAPPLPVAEGTAATFTLQAVASDSAESITVEVETLDVDVSSFTPPGVTRAGDDYTSAQQTFVLNGGNSFRGQFSVSTDADGTIEPPELLPVRITAATAGAADVVIAQPVAAAVITSDDTPDPVTLEVSDATVAEGDGTATFTITLAEGSTATDVDVAWQTQDGTARDGSDYTAVSDSGTLVDADDSINVIVPILPDDEFEPSEVLVLAVTGDGAETDPVVPATGTATITDDDEMENPLEDLTVSIADGAGAEPSDAPGPGGPVVLDLSVTPATAPHLPFLVDVEVTGGSATSGSDYVGPAPVALVAAHQGRVVVPVLADADDDEGNETVLVTISNPRTPLGAVFALVNGVDDSVGPPPFDHAIAVGTAQATGTIADGTAVPPDTPDPVLLEVSGATVAEGDGTATFTITLAEGSTATDVAVAYETQDGTAQAGTDYTGVESTEDTLADADDEIAVIVPILPDDEFEPSEVFVLAVTGDGAETDAVVPAKGTGVIEDDDELQPPLPTVSVSVGPATGSEPDPDATDPGAPVLLPLTVSPADTPHLPFLVTVEATPGSASAADFVDPAPAALVVNGSGSVVVPVLPDAEAEGDETFTVEISEPTTPFDLVLGLFPDPDPVPPAQVVTVGTATATGTIEDGGEVPPDTPDPVLLEVSDATVAEGDGTATFTITLAEGSTATDVDVAYETQDGTARDGSDYTAVSDSGTLADADDEIEVEVDITDDEDTETSEAFALVVKAAPDETDTVVPATGTATITDDEPPINPLTQTVSIRDASSVVEANGNSLDHTVRLSQPATAPVTVEWEVTGGTATPGEDVGTPSGGVLPPGTLDGVTGATSGASATPKTGVTTPTVPSLSVGGASPAGPVLPRVTLAQTEPLQTLLEGTVVFLPGEQQKVISVPVIDDSLDEDDETLLIGLRNASPTALIVGDAATGTITDNDAPPTLSIADESVVEGDTGTKTLTFDLTLSTASGRAVSVSAAAADGTATVADDDYKASTGTVNIPIGSTSGTFSVTINGDTKTEPNETLVVNLTAPVNATLADAQATGTITNDDAAPSIAVNDQTVVEGDDGASTTATFTISLSSPSASTVAVTAATADDTATTADDDYVAAGSLVSFAPEVTSRTFTVTVNGDNVFEADEVFNVGLSAPSNATIGDGTGVGTIDNDDDAPVVSIAGAGSIAEGGLGQSTPAAFELTLSEPAGTAVGVTASTRDGSAQASSDYLAKSQALTFAAGETTATFTVTVNGDNVFEDNETFHADLSAPVNVSIGTGAGSATILNDDAQPTTTTTSTTTTTLLKEEVRGATVEKAAPKGATTPTEKGYWVLGPDGTVSAFGDAEPIVTTASNGGTEVVGLASDGKGGLWLLDAVGGVQAHLGAEFAGSIPALREQGVPLGTASAVSIAGAAGGYLILDDAGGVHAFGGPGFAGSLPSLRNAGVSIGAAEAVDIAATPSGEGYLVLDAAGGVHAFGDAAFHGSIPGTPQARAALGGARAVAISLTEDGSGYWILDEAGGVYTFGSARFLGSLPGLRGSGVDVGSAPATDLEVKTDGKGYWIFDEAGGTFTFGTATYEGSVPARRT